MNLPTNQELLKQFTAFLLDSGLSSVSVKNYLSDVRHFFRFLDKEKKTDINDVFQNISKNINEYLIEQKTLLTPLATTNRRLASIRRLTTFLEIKFQVKNNISNSQTDQNISSPETDSKKTQTAKEIVDKDLTSKKILDQFKQHLISEKKTHSTVKNYLSDLYHYFSWIANQTPYNLHHLEQILSNDQLSGFIAYQKLCHTSSSVISRRQSSIKKLAKFCFNQGYIPKDPFEVIVQNTKLAPLSWLRRLIPQAKNPGNAPKSRLAIIYHKYNSLPLTPYFHLGLLVLATTTIAILGYNQIIKNARPSLADTSLTPPRRQLSFQGRLLDSTGTPIVTAINVNFKLWDQLSGGTEGTCTSAGGEDCLYKTGVCSVTPDQDGIFNSLIGDTVCGSEIPMSVFSDNQDVFLEVVVGAETLTPRQQIATVGYALNSETLQGYPAANPATINSVPVIDNNGDINISAASPSIISSSGNFNIEGQSLSLTTTAASGGDIVFQPDAIGGGQILAIGGTTTEDFFRVTNANLTTGSLISGYIGNDTATGSGNLLILSSGATESARFWITADGRTTISTATASADTAALTIDQNGTGSLLTASSSGISKFTIDNLGRIVLLDGVAHTIEDITGDLTLSSNSTNITLNDNVTFAGTTTLNGQTYTWPASAGSNTYVLQTNGSGTLSWVAQTGVGGNTLWDQQNGALYPLNSTVDFFIGGQSTASAQFAILNVNSGTPIASLSSDTVDVATFYDGNGNFSTTNRQSLVIGNSATYDSTGNILLHPNGTGSVGIGTTTPDRLLHAESNLAATNTVTYLERLTSMSTGTAANGIGAGIEFETEDSAGNAQLAAAIEGILSNATTTKEQGALVMRTADLGSATLNEAARFTNQGDLVTNGHTDITSLTNATDIFTYDTTKDRDGGNWRNNSGAKTSSWYNETLDDATVNCDPATHDRCGRREFPEKAFIITTSSNVYIYDAKDNYMWMKFSQGTDLSLGADANNNPSSVHANNGKVYIGTNGSAGTGAYIIDLKQDKITRFDATDARDFSGRIGTRNTDPGTAFLDQGRTSQTIIGNIVNDIHSLAHSEYGLSYFVVATDDGVSGILETELSSVYVYNSAGDDYNQVWLDQSGTLWATNETEATLEKWDNGIYSSNGSGPDVIWDETTTPALTNTAPTIQIAPSALFVTDYSSTVDHKSQTVYLGTDLGLTVLNTNYIDETNGSVKYYTNSYISEELIGYITGAWPFIETASLGTGGTNIQDVSYLSSTLTVPSGITSSITSVSGVRGLSLNFDGSDDYICSDGAVDDSTCEDNVNLDNPTTAGVWFKRDLDTGNIDTLVGKWGNGTGDQGYRIYIDTDDTIKFSTRTAGTVTSTSIATYTDTAWHHVVGTYNGTNQMLYIDGVLIDTDAQTGSITDSAVAFTVGADLSAAANTPANFFDGTVDESFVSQTALTPGQVKNMYQIGLQALQNHTASRITGVTGADNYQKLLGNATGGVSSTSRVFGVNLDDSRQFIYVGTNASSGNSGGLSVVGLDSDSVTDLYDNTANTTKDDDAGTQFNASDIVAMSVTGVPCSTGYNSGTTNCDSQVTLGIAGTNDSATTEWLETTDYSLYSALAQVTNSSQSKNKFTISDSFQVINKNLTDQTTGESTNVPALSVNSLGNIDYNYLGKSDGFGWEINDSNLISGTLFGMVSTSVTIGDLININAAALQSGNGIYISSNTITSGKLLNLNSSSGGLTGQLANLSFLGNSAGNTGNVLEVLNQGSLNTGASLYIKHYANGAGSLAMRVDDVSGDTTPFVIDVDGNVGVGDASPDHKLDVEGNIGLAASGYINWGDTDGTTGYGFRDNAGVIQFKNSAGAWANIGSATPFWDQQNGTLYPLNSTVDFLVGGQATSSAKFAVLNIDSGIPIASISGGLSGVSSSLSSNGILSTTNFQTLTLGNGTTGNIIVGTGSKSVSVSSDSWDVSNAGVFSGLTGLTSSGTINFSGLSASSAVYTDGSSNLTSIAPTTGILGFWQRSSGALAPWFITDSVNIGDPATASALIHLSGTSDDYSFFMEPLAIGFNTAITNPGLGGGLTALQVDGDILPGIDDDAFLGRAGTAWNRLYLSNGINNSAGTEQISILNRQLAGGQWNATSTLRVGDTTNSMPTGREFYVVGDASVSATFFAGGTSELLGNVTIGNGTGKLDVGTVDPPYTINGKKYATYLSGMIGVKEEVTGTVTTNEYIEGLGFRKTINFNSQLPGSDLWLFSKTTSLKENLDRLSVLLTPNGQAKTWYELDKNKSTLYIYASAPTEISFRLTAPRFDDASWTNTRTAGVDGFIINDEDENNYQEVINENTSYSSQIANIGGSYQLLVNGQEKKEFSSFSNSLIANLKTGVAVIADLFVDNLTINNKLITPIADIGQLNALNASISGTLYANNIKGKTIDKLNEQLNILDEKYSTASAILSSLQEKYTQYDSLFGSALEASSSSDAYDPLALSPLATTSGTLPDDLSLNSLNLNTLISNDILANGSIFTKTLSSFDTDLFIQPNGDKPVHLLANLMTLYPNGQVVIEGDLLVTGNLLANNIDSRTATISGTLAIGRGEIASDSAKILALFNEEGSIVSSVDSSGSANFEELTTGGLVIASGNGNTASNSATTTSNSTIGTASIATASSEIFVASSKVNDNTLVYITPISDTSNQVLYVKSKQSGVGFTVAVPQPVPSETSFNFWLVQTK